VNERLPELRKIGATVIVNVCGSTIDEYCEVSRVLSDAGGVAAIELNISCPNIKEGGIQFGCSLTGTYDVVSAVRKVTSLPLIPKLTPNVTDVASFARASAEAGADAISLVNTFLAMAIDIETQRPKLSNGVGGLSGPAIRPIAVRMVYECRQAVSLPILGMGGIASAEDAIEFMLAGATAVQVGTANFADPFIWKSLVSGLEAYLQRHKLARASDLVGLAHGPALPPRRRRSRWRTNSAARSVASRSASSSSPRRVRRSSARWSIAAIAYFSI
jgi:dihydroorotate dehydrogenase (NAD+) catalytic subunit